MIEAAFNAYLLTKFVFLKIFRNEKKEALRLKIKNFYFWTFFIGFFSFPVFENQSLISISYKEISLKALIASPNLVFFEM